MKPTMCATSGLDGMYIFFSRSVRVWGATEAVEHLALENDFIAN